MYFFGEFFFSSFWSPNEIGRSWEFLQKRCAKNYFHWKNMKQCRDNDVFLLPGFCLNAKIFKENHLNWIQFKHCKRRALAWGKFGFYFCLTMRFLPNLLSYYHLLKYKKQEKRKKKTSLWQSRTKIKYGNIDQNFLKNISKS